MSVVISDLSKSYGERAVLDGLNIEIADREVLCLLGDSGCGKTTLLNCVAGLTEYTGSVSGVPERLSYVFQKERLLKNLTVAGNLEYVLAAVMGREERKARIREMLSLVELEDWADKYPAALSEGMAQRAALARAFGFPSELLLMDEPFRALDTGLKLRVMDAFLKLWERDPRTVIFVTHDIDEALLLSSRILMLTKNPARIRHEVLLSSPLPPRRLTDPDILRAREEVYRVLGL